MSDEQNNLLDETRAAIEQAKATIAALSDPAGVFEAVASAIPGNERVQVAESFGAAVRRMREEHGWTQDELGLRMGAKLGTGKQLVSRIENGGRGIGEDTLRRLARAFNTHLTATKVETLHGKPPRR